jgi:hypothetical protein
MKQLNINYEKIDLSPAFINIERINVVTSIDCDQTVMGLPPVTPAVFLRSK